MKRLLIHLSRANLLLIALCLHLSCGKDTANNADQHDFISVMKDEAYLGDAKSTLYVGGLDPLPSLSGTSSLSVDKIRGDSVTVSLLVNLPGGDGFTLGIPGKQQGKNWNATFAGGSFYIKENGAMEGTVVAGNKEFTWDGYLADDGAILTVRTKYLAADGDIPAESILTTEMTLNRSGSDAPGNANGCTNVVWETRPVFNLYSGGVDLIRVPVCHP
ncbi:hypothetical protein FAZ19_07435 [Sphingobacterium alkalisoli]|uniref:Uncharacterized protein n=1 Tax=Sphingobacterium alkalisoli TaxID=1874115 RepID=A0A4U0H4U7_9SPHI|nr:hypothetical protein [Sphingobacterium alkalisoli]TJY66743.1 hypothetical protein FAZ19_07435 [Sphingobacterium alkalisoli]GGH14479.1 hypothetical protein GCM10011418_15460 [Sphingobacterium alkalisoli]